MHTPVVDIAANHVNPLWIMMSWEGISAWSETGGDDVTYFEVAWDMGTNGENWVVLTDELDGLQYTFKHEVSEHFPSGSLQQYRVRGKNGVGLGIYSIPLTV